MYISPLLLLVPEFAADYAEENEQLFDAICLRKYEELDNIIDLIDGLATGDDSGYGYGCSLGGGYFSCFSFSFGSGSGSGRNYGDGSCSGDGSGAGFGFVFGYCDGSGRAFIDFGE